MKVYTLFIEHRHGHDITVHASDDGASKALAAYVRQWWNDEMDGKQMPSAEDEMVAQYFEQSMEFGDCESFEIEEKEIDNA